RACARRHVRRRGRDRNRMARHHVKMAFGAMIHSKPNFAALCAFSSCESLVPFLRRIKVTILRATFAFLVVLFSSSCQLGLEGAPCPCATGWTCCPDANVCVKEGASCPTADGGSGLTVTPMEVTTNGLKIEQFSASLPATWSVDEGPAGGTVDANGQY